MKITHELIEQMKSKKGGWTKNALAKLGVPWPPVRGWKRRIIGTEVRESQLLEESVEYQLGQSDCDLGETKCPFPKKTLDRKEWIRGYRDRFNAIR